MNILIYYLPLTVGASVYEELLFRRTLIPSLEQRGMSTSFAILSSSLLFALAHLPNDLLSANIPGIIMHISAVFLIGISTGLIYTLTRNIVYSIIIHGVLNFISFSGPLVALISNSPLTLTYNILYWTIYALGIGVIIFSLVQFFKKREVEWVILLKEKNHYPIFYGFIGFLVIGTISLFIPLVMQSIVVKLEIAVYNVLWYFIILIICYSSALIIFFVLRVITVYISKNESSKVKNSIKKLQMEVKKIE
ncbi:MAG: lysostaphin resistance A-like protein [Promethearchaeota archaeon]